MYVYISAVPLTFSLNYNIIILISFYLFINAIHYKVRSGTWSLEILIIYLRVAHYDTTLTLVGKKETEFPVDLAYNH